MAEVRRGAVTILLSDDEWVRALNRQFRGADKPTNVLSFPAEGAATEPGAPPYLGDVILALETVAREAGAQGKSFLDHATHLAVHGVLHLLGHTHDADEDAARMDGAGPFTIYLRILLPLAAPGLFSAGVLSFLGSWGEFMHAFTVSLGIPEVQTVPVAVLSFSQAFQLQWSWVAAGTILAILPVVLLVVVFQRVVVGGLTSGAVQ